MAGSGGSRGGLTAAVSALRGSGTRPIGPVSPRARVDPRLGNGRERWDISDGSGSLEEVWLGRRGDRPPGPGAPPGGGRGGGGSGGPPAARAGRSLWRALGSGGGTALTRATV